MLKTYKYKGFTLIEVVSSLMIFSIGASISLGVFNFNASNRRMLEEHYEAQSIALNLLKTFALQQETGDKLATGGSSWDYHIGHLNYKAGNTSVYPVDGTVWQFPSKTGAGTGSWATVPTNVGADTLNLTTQPLTAANDKYRYFPDSPSHNSIYQYNYFLKDVQDFVKIKRTKLNWDTIATPSPEDVDPLGLYVLTVAVTWPKSVEYENNRKRVVVSTVVPQ